MRGCLATTTGTNTTATLNLNSNRHFVEVTDCEFYDQTYAGPMIDVSGSNLSGYVFSRNVFRGGAGTGIEIDWPSGVGNDSRVSISNNVIEDMASHGINWINTPVVTSGPSAVTNNLLTNNGGYGMNVTTSNTAFNDFAIFARGNAFYNNTSGEMNNLTDVDNVTLSGDPYTDAASDDYTLNDTAGGGAACKNAGIGYDGT